MRVNLIKAVFCTQYEYHIHGHKPKETHTLKPTDTKNTTTNTPWPRWTKAISGSTFESRTDENRQKTENIKRSDNGVKLHTQVHPCPSVFFIPLLLGNTLKGMKSQGMTIVTVSSAPTLASAPAPALSSSLVLANQWITRVGEAQEMPGPGWYISHDGWSCCPPHWYSARLRSWARSLTLNGYLLLQSPPASGAQRGSVSGRRGWMELPSGRASQPQSDSQTATAHIPSSKWTEEPMGASGQVRQTQAYWEAAREGRMEGRYCSFSQRPASPDISKLLFALLRKQLHYKIAN